MENSEYNLLQIKKNTEKFLKELPEGTELVVATKGRRASQINAAISAGAKAIGENYVAEAKEKLVLGRKILWHLIGHLQSNKAKEAVRIFDMIETLDSIKLARRINEECKKIGKIMPILIEVNSASEAQKHGLPPKRVEDFLREILKFDHLKPMGLMTMGPFIADPQDARPYFRLTKRLFDKIKTDFLGKLSWTYLSMGMSDSYKIALEEGANIVRIGTGIFGSRGNKRRQECV